VKSHYELPDFLESLCQLRPRRFFSAATDQTALPLCGACWRIGAPARDPNSAGGGRGGVEVIWLMQDRPLTYRQLGDCRSLALSRTDRNVGTNFWDPNRQRRPKPK